MAQDKVSAILDWPEPTKIRDVQQFLGFANFYRRFIKRLLKNHYSPHSSSPKKDTVLGFDDAARNAFKAIKQAFTGADILRHFDPNLETIIETDASDYAISAVLSQYQEQNSFSNT